MTQIQPISTDAASIEDVSFAETATLTNVASSATNVTLLSANPQRKLLKFFNDSTSTVYIKFGATATTSSFTYLLASATPWEPRGATYQGRIDAIWTSANGFMRITEG